MISYNEEQLMMKEVFRDFLAKELAPIQDDIEHNGVPPFDFMRKLQFMIHTHCSIKHKYEKNL